MNFLDLSADIIPGKSAAGFLLGASLEIFKKSVSVEAIWYRESGQQLGFTIENTKGWLFVPEFNLYTYGNGALELKFSKVGSLSSILLGAPYQGKLLGIVSIGENLALVNNYCFELTYDPNDEVHYPKSHLNIIGIEFNTDGETLSLHPEQKIEKIRIFEQC